MKKQLSTNQEKCQNCHHFSDEGYKENRYTQNIGFCSRFTETTNKFETCIAFLVSTEKEDYFKNLRKAQDLKINLPKQLDLFQ